MSKIGLDNNWDAATKAGGPVVHAYIVDTGIVSSHSCFQHGVLNYVSGTCFTALGGSCYAPPGELHGTHVASLLGGKYVGAAPGYAWLHSVRVGTDEGGFAVDDLIAGITWINTHHVSPAIVNMSLGGYGRSEALETAILNSRNTYDITYFAAAGNDLAKACYITPGWLDDVITVGGTQEDDRWFIDLEYYKGSNYGVCIDINAPAKHIWGAYREDYDQVVQMSGTSMATPLVAGLAARWLTDHPNATPDEVSDQLLASASRDRLISKDSGTWVDWHVKEQTPNLLIYSNLTSYERNHQWALSTGGTLYDYDGLEEWPLYANGPCQNAPVLEACHFDTFALLEYPGVSEEHITAYGKYWVYDKLDQEWDVEGVDMTELDHFMDRGGWLYGPCALCVGVTERSTCLKEWMHYDLPYGHCKIDSQSFWREYSDGAWHIHELITAHTYFFEWVDGVLVDSGRMDTRDKYQCPYIEGEYSYMNCRIDAHDAYEVDPGNPDGAIREVFFTRGGDDGSDDVMYYYEGDTPLPGSGTPVKDTIYDDLCEDEAGGYCHIDTYEAPVTSSWDSYLTE